MPSMKSQVLNDPDYRSPMDLDEWLRIWNLLQRGTCDGFELAVSGTAIKMVYTDENGHTSRSVPIFRPEAPVKEFIRTKKDGKRSKTD